MSWSSRSNMHSTRRSKFAIMQVGYFSTPPLSFPFPPSQTSSSGRKFCFFFPSRVCLKDRILRHTRVSQNRHSPNTLNRQCCRSLVYDLSLTARQLLSPPERRATELRVLKGAGWCPWMAKMATGEDGEGGEGGESPALVKAARSLARGVPSV